MRWLDDRFALKQISGLWFACQFRPVPKYGPFKAYDHALGEMVGRGGLVRREGVYMHCIAKRQLSRRELRRYKLRNAVVLPGKCGVQDAVTRIEDRTSYSLPQDGMFDYFDSASSVQAVADMFCALADSAAKTAPGS